MSEKKELKTWYAYFSDWQDLSKGIIQKEQWALMLNSGAEFQVVDKQAYESQSQLIKEKDDRIKELEFQLADRSEKYKIAMDKGVDVLSYQLKEKDAEIARLKQCCKDFEFVLEGSRAVKQSDEKLDKREDALMRALDWSNDKKVLAKGDGDE